ncbi:benzoate 4-monooxygenase cytochrome P450 [Aspergillus welwitschiae]|uniref:Benzoate 4-monooxygenase cytochrome P450 n=1 Tax=Aspergillus welwitschiae TaxID=1341132 RepID=A0A3F3QD29_9EURO|nr:benzoate 4-monooxygenase cytochrome P450 [Aspergillus welwitschiae]RDH36959.1 benzoate 4-monooxygenase cytochrome P450 [Aspergillus welwitschiae]
MTVLIQTLTSTPMTSAGLYLALILIVYSIYQRYLHPLAKYPGPFLACLTDLWQVYQFLTLKQPYTLTELHEKYGPIVRYGPDKLSITHEGAIQAIYQKGGRGMPKTEFYDAYGAAHPNVFGMRDEEQHSIRRRHMSHGFSMSYVKEMEQYLDLNIRILRDKIREHSSHNRAFDLKKALHYYVIDVLGELAFSQSFGIQETDDEARVPPVIEHSLLAAVTGAWPAMTATLKKYLPLVPYKPLQQLFAGRKACADLASECVRRRLGDFGGNRMSKSDDRKDILTNLILAKHPDTGEHLTQTDLETEAFGFIIAGTHTTSATTTLLFYHLLHNPRYMEECVKEIETNLPHLTYGETAYSVSAAEAALPFLRNCIRENFRITPVFTMPLARRVMSPTGVMIDGQHIPQGTSIAVCNHAFHHNPDVWGVDHNIFNPYRWENTEIAAKARLLMHFGLGGRQCIGKTIAMTNIYKIMSTLLTEFNFELADKQAQRKGIPELISVGISDLKEPLMVRAHVRMEKPGVQHFENDGDGGGDIAAKGRDHNDLEAFDRSHDESIKHSESDALTEDHRQYLIQRYGTVELDPIPDMTDADPYNWPTWKKIINLALVAFHAMMATFTASSIQSAFVEIAEDLGVSVQRASYLTSLVIAILGGAPLFWMPLSNRYGRRPIFLLSLLCSLVANVGCAKSPSYATMGFCRALVAFFICPAAAIGSAVVAETFFKKDRARCMGVWAVMVTLGVPLAPLLFGFVTSRVGYRWIYWILAITNGVQFIIYSIFGQETLYIRGSAASHVSNPTLRQRFLHVKRIDPAPLEIWDFLRPLGMAIRPCIMIPAAAYAMIFLLGGILPSIEMPQLFPEMFGLDSEQVGLQFIAMIIGSLLGDQVGGFLSDRWMLYGQKKTQRPVAPEFRLWISYPGIILTIVGVVIFLVQLDHASSQWNITPLVGVTIAAVGNQIVTTVSFTYAVDCYRSEAASVGVFITLVRQTWGFIGPFW